MTKKEKRPGEDWTADAYWKQPVFDPTQTGDLNHNDIFQAVGAALSSWEELEDTLANMITGFGTDETNSITVHSHQIQRHMFGMIESSSTHLKMLQVSS